MGTICDWKRCACVHQFTVGLRQKMASAKFLEEALSTDVDESAVSAIVGSLETQLGSTNPSGAEETNQQNIVHQNHVNSINTTIANGGKTSALKHGVSNGGSETVDVVLNSDVNKSGSVEHQNISNNAASAVRSVTPTGAYANQVTSNLGIVQSNVTSVSKSQDGIKIAYTNNQQPGSNTISRIFSTQAVTLPNGTVGLNPSNVVQASSGAVQTIVSTNTANVNKAVGNSAMDQGKPTGTAVVIKSTPNNSSQGVSSLSTMTLPGNANAISTAQGVPSIVTLAKPLNQGVSNQQTTTAIVGGQPTQILQPNVQILNMNALRPGTPTQAGAKGVPQRVVIGGPQVVGKGPVQPGITLQAFQGLAPGTQGHLLLKTENGQYQLLRVGPAPVTASSTQAPANTTPFRVLPQIKSNIHRDDQRFLPPPLERLPGCSSKASKPSFNPNEAAPPVQTPQQQVPVLAQTQQNATSTATAASNTSSAGKSAADNQTKEKCRKFLANLLELSSREPKAVERNVRTLIQDLVNAKVEPEQFCDKLEKLLNASPQPCLIGFLKKSLPLLRQSMVNKELFIDGIIPPPPSVIFQTATPTPTVATPQSIQVRTAAVQMSTTSQMRVITQPSNVRPGQPIQHRIITMTPANQSSNKTVSSAVRVASAGVNAASLRPTLTTVRTPSGPQAVTLRPGSLITRPTTIQRPQSATVIPNTAIKPASPLTSAPTTLQHHHILNKLQHTTLAKDKKSYSASGVYTGDDDINDVAAMGGVNLAEESQRILGSTEFVGTQIRSCKDELFLKTDTLVHKIAQIVAKHKLGEPNVEVAALISHATQERLKTLVEKLAIIAEHRIDMNKFDSRYEVTQDIRAQLKCLEEIDKAERKRHEEQEREVLMRAAKSRTKPEDPEQAKLKAKAKEMQKAEMEELRQREANITALQAIGPRKKLKLDEPSNSNSDTSTPLPSTRPTVGPRPRVKRVTMRDMIFLLEQEKESRRSDLLFKAYFK